MKKRLFIFIATVLILLVGCNTEKNFDITEKPMIVNVNDESVESYEGKTNEEELNENYNKTFYKDKDFLGFMKDSGGSLDSKQIIYESHINGNENMIIALGDKSHNEYINELFFINIIDNEYYIVEEYKSPFLVYDVEVTNLENYHNEVILIKVTNSSQLKGFNIYDFEEKSIKKITSSISATSAGYDYVTYGQDNKTINGYIQNRWSYDYFYFDIENHFKFINGNFVNTDFQIGIEVDKYNKEPESVVKLFLRLNELKNKNSFINEKVDEILREICIVKIEEPVKVGYHLASNNLFDLKFDVKIKENDNTCKIQVTMPFSTESLIMYNLINENNKWYITEETPLMTWDSFIKECILNNSINLLNGNAYKYHYFNDFDTSTYENTNLKTIFNEYDLILFKDLDGDSIDEVFKVGNDEDKKYTEVYELQDGQYNFIQRVEGKLNIIGYNGQIHYISSYDENAILEEYILINKYLQYCSTFD